MDRVSYFVCKFSRDNDIVSKYPGHVEIPASRNSWNKPSQTLRETFVLGAVHLKWSTDYKVGCLIILFLFCDIKIHFRRNIKKGALYTISTPNKDKL